MANQAKKQLKAAKKEEKQFNKLQEAQNIRTRIAAQKSGSPVPYGAQQKASFFKSTDAQPTSISTLTPQQQQLVNQLSGLVGRGLTNLNLPGQQSSFAPIAGEARRNFSQNTLPTIAERFAGLGRSSSGLNQSLSGAASDFESQLAAAQAQYGLQEQGLQSSNLMNLLGAGLNPQFDYAITPGQNSGVRNIWNAVSQPLIGAGINYLAGGFSKPSSSIPDIVSQYIKYNQQSQQRYKDSQQNYQQPMSINGSGVGSNSFGFSGKSNPLSVQNLASSGYPQINDVFNQGQYKF
jgi:hypothetical protein